MSKYTIIGTIGGSDDFASKYKKGAKEEVFPVNLLKLDGACAFGVDRALHDLTALGIEPSTVGLELLNLALLVQIADNRLNRIQTSQDAWSREIKLILPVTDLNLWKSTGSAISEILNFLTGDFWELGFRKHSYEYPRIPVDNDKKPFPVFDSLCLFSGGLDSAIGAIDLLEKGKKPLFISYAGGEGAVSGPQETVFNLVTDQYKAKIKCHRLRLQSLRPPKFPNIGRENSTRGRSFLFFALAVFAGTGLKKNFKLIVPENGLIALNVPLDSTRLGALSTRTTHPHYITKWNALIKSLGIDGALLNPYWNQTKGEMVAACKNQKFLKTILSDTVSCAHPSVGRYSGDSKHHCGHCVPCIIRQAAVNYAWGKAKDTTDYRGLKLTAQKWDSMKAEGRQIRAFQLAASRLVSKPGLAKLLIYKQGPLAEQGASIDQLAQVYLRGMTEVNSLLKNVQTYSSQ